MSKRRRASGKEPETSSAKTVVQPVSSSASGSVAAAPKQQETQTMYVVMLLCDDRLAPRKFPVRVFNDLGTAKQFVDRYVDPEGEPNSSPVYQRFLCSDLYNKPFYSNDAEMYVKGENENEDEEKFASKQKERDEQYSAFLKELGISQKRLLASITRIGIESVSCA